MSSRAILGTALSFSLLVVAVACGSDGSDGANGSNGNGNGNPNGGGFGTNGTGDGGNPDGNNGNGNCSGNIDMYIMFDRSKSMLDGFNGAFSSCTGGAVNTKWCRAVTALKGYFTSAGANGQAAALQFFPVDSHTAALCSTGDKYNVPAFPVGDPAYHDLSSPDFDGLLTSTVPNSGNTAHTPTEAAIRGLTRFTSEHRRGGRVTIGILITDGEPNGCDENRTHLSDLLKAHHDATQIRTYVIGMTGADFDNLEDIAEGGDAPMHPDTVGALTHACGGSRPTECRHWNVGDGDPAAFQAALAAIQESADGCKAGGGFINPVN